jgi:tetratricopeptide (TPR) repeat protein
MLAGLQTALAQTVGVSRTRVPASAAGSELDKLLADAQEATDRKDYLTAAKDYENYLLKQPNDANVHFQLGYTYTALQRSQDAKTEYQKAIDLDPKMMAAYLNLALTLLETDPNEAAGPLQKASELAPDQARPKFLLGLALERSGKLPAAIEQYEAAKKLDGKDYDIRFSLGRALLNSDHVTDAESEFRASLMLRPDSGPSHLGVAKCLKAEKKFDAEQTELASYLAMQPKDIDARLDRASALLELARSDDALAELDRAAAEGPEGLRAFKLRSEVYLGKKRYADAIPALEKAAALDPQDPEIPARLGHAYMEKKDYPASVKELIVAYKMAPNADGVLGDLVAAQYLNNNCPAALDGLNLLSKREQLPAPTWFVRGSCYDKLGMPAEAIEAYQRFLQLNKDLNNDMYFEATARVRTLTRELQNKR